MLQRFYESVLKLRRAPVAAKSLHYILPRRTDQDFQKRQREDERFRKLCECNENQQKYVGSSKEEEEEEEGGEEEAMRQELLDQEDPNFVPFPY